MTNFLLKNPDCIFIHIHKTGGTSIRRGAWGKRQRAQQAGFIPEAWGDLFRFAFVRDPLTRFLSVYRMFTGGTRNYPDGVLVERPRPMTLPEFFDIVRDESIVFDHRRRTLEERIRHHAIPQTHPYNCLRQAHFVGRFETLEEDFARVAAHVGLPAHLPHMNITAEAEADPRATLGPALADAVAAYYAGDLAFIERDLPRYRGPLRGAQGTPARVAVDRLRQSGAESG